MMKMIIVFLGITALAGCGENTDKGHVHNPPPATMPAPQPKKEVQTLRATFAQVEPYISRHIQALVGQYLHIKDALVAAEPAGVPAIAEKMLAELHGVDKSYLSFPQKEAYDKSTADLRKQLEKLTTATDLAAQRVILEPLSQAVFQLAKDFGYQTNLYREYCPMAFDNRGAAWLSDSDSIRNPYFGDEMLKCGTVTDILNR
ncbi:MAG: DUF3347 domain-containing protein [Saprospiraceae bacterium]|jgi:Cu(I)/Ag(I) efflux system membrane fusion protein|nr:DUF3347 domain-containing protein [Saprospiraceae bacterium]